MAILKVGVFLGAGVLTAAVVVGYQAVNGVGESLACPVAEKHLPGGPDGMGGCWPGEDNTGVRAGVELTSYTGPSTVTTADAVIDGKLVANDLVVNAPGVVIRDSRIEGTLTLRANGSVVVEDSEVTGSDGWMGATVQSDDETASATTMTLRRVNVDKGQHSIVCVNCVVEDSYLHGQQAPTGIDTHNNAYWTGGGGYGAVLRHNTAWCTPEVNNVGGGCSSDIFIGGDFGQPSNFTVDRNLFMPSPSASYCGYLGSQPPKRFPNPTDIVVTDNIFRKGGNGKCGGFGTTTAWDSAAPGAVWSGNAYDDGTPVIPNT